MNKLHAEAMSRPVREPEEVPSRAARRLHGEHLIQLAWHIGLA